MITSPVTDAGYSRGFTTDERGAPRPYDFTSIPNAAGGDGSDIGAFELGTADVGLDIISNGVVVSWPGYYGDFLLQSSTNLGGSNNWITVTDMPALVGNQFLITIRPPNPNFGSMFFRLMNTNSP